MATPSSDIPWTPVRQHAIIETSDMLCHPVGKQTCSIQRAKTARSEHVAGQRPEHVADKGAQYTKDGFVVVAKDATHRGQHNAGEQTRVRARQQAPTAVKFIPRRQKSFWCGPGFQPASRESRSRVAQLRETRRITTKVAQSDIAPSNGGGYAAPSAMGPPQQTPVSEAIPFSFIPANEVYSCVVPLSGYVTLAHFDAYFKASREPCPLAKRKRAREDDDDEGGDSKRRCYIHGRQEQPMRSYSFCVRD